MFVRAFLAILIPLFVVAAFPAAPAGESRVWAVGDVDGLKALAWASGAWASLRPVDTVAVESKGSAGAGTQVKIACDDSIVVTFGTGIEVNLYSLASPVDNAVLHLVEGSVGRLAPEGGPSGIEMCTAVAIASVRLTKWRVKHAAETGSPVFVRARGRPTLGGGTGLSVGPGRATVDVKTWGAPRIVRSTAALGSDWR